jgi:hypothetical protein
MVQARINALEIENAELRRQLEERPTLRDQFAIATLRAFIRNNKSPFDPKSMADGAYTVADAMMEARDVCD